MNVNPDPGTGPLPEPPNGPLDLKQFVVILDDGKFSVDNTTTPDVDAIFNTHIPAFITERGGGPVPLMFWAHGGLVTREEALATATQHLPWWLSNGIYPVYFVWDSGLLATIGDFIEGKLTALKAGPMADGQTAFRLNDLTDPVVEAAVRAAGAPGVWQKMKDNARTASESPNDGAGYVAQGLQTFMKDKPNVTLHAVGHSAGSIFHSFFLPAVLKPGNVQIETLSLLAPAIRTDDFRGTLQPLIGGGVHSAAMFTMNEGWERNDNVLGLYNKSLLYLIRTALEPQPPVNTDLLGLQECVRKDTELSQLFQPAPTATNAEVIWSISIDGPPRSRSASITHTGFDTDVATMDSVARRILDVDDIISFGAATHQGVLSAASPAMLPGTVKDKLRPAVPASTGP